MPAPFSHFAGAAGEVLLVEEYDALAAAISAALKKFAPDRPIRRARTLDAGIFKEAAPALVIIDFDPPLAGPLEFLQKLRASAPNARLLVIAAGLPGEIYLRELPTVATYIPKPFGLDDLGHAIRQLLEEPPGTPRAVAHLGLSDIVPLLALADTSGVVRLAPAPRNPSGQLHFAKGQLLHASVSGLTGLDALREMLRWGSAEFGMTEHALAAERSLEHSWATNLLRAHRSLPVPVESSPTTPEKPPPAASAAPPPIPRDGKKVLVIDDTETLRIFVEEMLAASDPRLQITAAPTAGDGLQLCRAFRPELILLDYSLPDFNGDEVCRRLLEDETLAAIPIIMMSGHTAPMNETAARYENVVATLPKPFLSETLVDLVTRTLAHPPARRPRPSPLPPIHPPSTTTKTVAPAPAAAAAPKVHAAARIPGTSNTSVLLNMPLEVISLHFTADLRVAALKARPAPAPVSLQVDPRAFPAARQPDAAFEIVRVVLDPRGRFRELCLSPTPHRPASPPAPKAFNVERLALLPGNGQGGLQITPAAGAPLRIQLIAAFSLSGVELTAAFGIGRLFVTAPAGGRLRVILPGQAGNVGVSFSGAQVSLDQNARITEILLDSVVAQTAPPSTPVRPGVS